jgi:hypothetical protein
VIREDFLVGEDIVGHEYLVERRGYAMTVGGKKLHLMDMREPLTFCGLAGWQLVIVEEPIPDSVMCEWCRAAKEKQ